MIVLAASIVKGSRAAGSRAAPMVLAHNVDMMKTSRLARPLAGYRFACAFVLGTAMVGAGVSSLAGGDGAVSAQAQDPCALLTASEIQPLAAKANIGDGVPNSTPAIGSISCRYAWGVGVNRLTVNVNVTEASRMFPGLSPDQIKQRLVESVRVGSADAIIPDVGDAAVFKADSPYYASATASVKGRILEVHVDGAVAREKRDQVISLLKSAVSRL
jgi:hypothetical protein